MPDYPKDQLVSELMSIARVTERELSDRGISEPLDLLRERCPTLLSIVREVILPAGATDEDVIDTTKQLLRITAFKTISVKDWVRRSGDLLGLTNKEPGSMEDMPIEEREAKWRAYKTEGGRKKAGASDAPRTFNRHAREIRKMLGARNRYGSDYSITWWNVKEKLADGTEIDRQLLAFTQLVDELCTYWDDEDGKLTKFLQSEQPMPIDEEASQTQLLVADDVRADQRSVMPQPTDVKHVARQRLSWQKWIAAGVVALALVGSLVLFINWNGSQTSPPNSPQGFVESVPLAFQSGDRPGHDEQGDTWMIGVDGKNSIDVIYRPSKDNLPFQWVAGSLEVEMNPQSPCPPIASVSWRIEVNGSQVAHGVIPFPTGGSTVHAEAANSPVVRLHAEIENPASGDPATPCTAALLTWKAPQLLVASSR